MTAEAQDGDTVLWSSLAREERGEKGGDVLDTFLIQRSNGSRKERHKKGPVGKSAHLVRSLFK